MNSSFHFEDWQRSKLVFYQAENQQVQLKNNSFEKYSLIMNAYSFAAKSGKFFVPFLNDIWLSVSQMEFQRFYFLFLFGESFQFEGICFR